MPRIVGDSKTYPLDLEVTLGLEDPKPLGKIRVDAPSISTIAKVFDTKSGALTGWAFKTGLEGVLELSKQGIDVRGWSYQQLYGAMKEIGHTPYIRRGKAAARGNEAHELLELLATGVELETAQAYKEQVSEEAAGYCAAVWDWWFTNIPTTVVCEEQVWGIHPKPFAGTLDFLGWRDDGHLVLTDLKTSKDVFPEHVIQIAGYESGLHQSRPDLEPRDGFSIVLAREDGSWQEIEVPLVSEAWDAAVNAWYATELLGSILHPQKGE